MIGLVFDQGYFWVLGSVLVGLEVVVIGCTAIAWRVAGIAEREEAALASSDEMDEIRTRLMDSHETERPARIS